MPRTSTAVLMAALAALPVAAQDARERAQVPEKYRWNLADIYPSDEAWRAAKAALEARLPTVERHKGKLGASAAELLAGLEQLHELQKELSRIYVYASMGSDQDTRDAAHQAMKQEISQVATAFSAATAFVEPEIL